MERQQRFLKQKQILFFVMAGGLSAILEIGLMKLLSIYIPRFFPREINWHGIAYPISNILSTSCAIIFNYFLSIWFVFESGKHSKRKEILYFISVSLASTLLSLAIFNFLFYHVIFQPVDLIFYTLSPIIMSKAIAIVLVSIINFFMKKNIIFNG